MEFILGFVIGAVLGSVLALGVQLLRARREREHLREAHEAMRDAFSALASEALDANAKRLSEQADARLDGKKALIDQSIKAVNERLGKLSEFVQRIETDRKADLGRLSSSVNRLTSTAEELHRMLASSQRRGAWGERMAEDILRLAGLQEGVNYLKQSAADAESGRPDFTFLLPNDLCVNMDVKFPLEAYKAYVDAESDQSRAEACEQLTRAVRGHIRAVASRGYIDSAGGTVDYVILFIPAEQIYALVLAECPDLVDEALGRKVVLASPLTLYAMLAVIRQAAENANIAETANEVIALLGQFRRQWQKYNEELDRLGSQLETVGRTYETLRTTRSNMLQRPLDKIDELRSQRELPDED